MPDQSNKPFNLLIIGQKGRIGYEALLLLASLRSQSPDFAGKIIVAEPQPGPMWSGDPRMPDTLREAIEEQGGQIRPFESEFFGSNYPQGNKIEGLRTLPEGEPFLFLDSDTLILGDLAGVPFDFSRPSASMRRTGTWPVEELYWPGYSAVWKSLYDRFELEFDGSMDLSQPDDYWERYLYFNAGWFFGADPKVFAQRYMSYAREIWTNPPAELAIQPLVPWLDQIALPLVIHASGGGRPGPELSGMDGAITNHYRVLSLLYARERDEVVEVLHKVSAPNRIKKVLKQYEPMRRMIYQDRGTKVRALFDRNNLPRKEQQLRNKIKKNGFWMR